jgi:hypothetical protein
MEKLVLQTQVAKVTTTDSEGELFDTTPHSEGLQLLYPYLRQDRTLNSYSDRSSSITMSVDFFNPLMCANIVGGVQCQNKADRITCTDCHLVFYCSEQCQSSHAAEHNANTCKHEYRSPQWKPQWFVERRLPNTISFSPEPWNLPFSAVFMRSNMPAIDLLDIGRNEGQDAKDRDFNIMCAASGDLRNVVKTVAGLPKDYAGDLSIVMNDIDFGISARNAILLMTALLLDTKQAVPAMVHLWYSARLSKAMLRLVQDTLLPS